MKSNSHFSVNHVVIDQLVKKPLSLAWAVPEVDSIAIALRTEQSKYRKTAKKWACSKYTEEFTTHLAGSNESVMSIMYSMAMLVALEIPSLITNSLTSEAETLSNSSLFESIILASMPCIMKASPSSDMSLLCIFGV